MYHIHYTYPTEGKCKQSIRNSEINNELSLIQVCHQDGLGKRQGRQLPPRIENGTSIHISGSNHNTRCTWLLQTAITSPFHSYSTGCTHISRTNSHVLFNVLLILPALHSVCILNGTSLRCYSQYKYIGCSVALEM